MTHLIVRFVTAILIAPLAASASDADDLKAVHEQTVKALNSGDLDSYLAHIHEQGITFYSCGPTSGVEGKASCQKQWEEFFAKAERVNFTPLDTQIRVIGSTGIVWGNYQMAFKPTGGEETISLGRFTLVYTKIDDKWVVVCQENSPNPPSEQFSQAEQSER